MQKTCVRHLLKRKIEIFRYSNPNTNEFVEKVCKMEGTAGFAFASGMAAVYSTMAALLNSGDHIFE
jgi:O-succinylhomoserine sulfhydrylase